MRIISKDEIIKNERQLLAAMKSSDISVLDYLLHDDLIFTNHMGQVLTKEMDLDAHRSGSLGIHDIQISEQAIRFIEDIAIVTVKKYIAGKYNDEAFEGTFRFTRIWKMFNHDWKIIAVSSVLLQ
ncbi:nuclear transport factor 2 family protein [Mucilaginibacter sp. HC2]|uniref:nuclear transport factor 2 family protein n=1 Tax=Mucilaginibacter inviolabilis TaxID=2714892 RepID=UPI001407F5BE|nr:nuclear transport factor 2 family protein [Mucilaginibacter inviolabilis]NHA05063.1 nuclear transport factor 2 family protein [Mucilaginibacter inviolabilis]